MDARIEIDPDGHAGESYVKVTDIKTNCSTGQHFASAYRPGAPELSYAIGECFEKLFRKRGEFKINPNHPLAQGLFASDAKF